MQLGSESLGICSTIKTEKCALKSSIEGVLINAIVYAQVYDIWKNMYFIMYKYMHIYGRMCTLLCTQYKNKHM